MKICSACEQDGNGFGEVTNEVRAAHRNYAGNRKYCRCLFERCSSQPGRSHRQIPRLFLQHGVGPISVLPSRRRLADYEACYPKEKWCPYFRGSLLRVPKRLSIPRRTQHNIAGKPVLGRLSLSPTENRDRTGTRIHQALDLRRFVGVNSPASLLSSLGLRPFPAK